MKKLFIVLLAFVATMSVYAQQIKVYNNSDSIPTAVYVNNQSESYKVVFSNSQEIQIVEEGSQEVVDVYNNTSNNKYKVVISPSSSEFDEHDYVDFGLESGTLWATLNVGAETPGDQGTGFAWGETETKNVFDMNTYKWSENGKYTKYYSDDGKSTLDLEDDAARANWGGDWQIPSLDDFVELISKCNISVAQNEGIKLTSKTDNSKYIILPFNIDFWTNTVTNIKVPTQAKVVKTFSNGMRYSQVNVNRTAKAFVRPVIKNH